jgi:hypothetical protein
MSRDGMPSMWNKPINFSFWQWCTVAARIVMIFCACGWISHHYQLPFMPLFLLSGVACLVYGAVLSRRG